MNPTQTNDTPRKSGQRGADTSQPTGGDWHVLISGVHTDAEQHEIATEVDGCHVTLAELPVESSNGMMRPDGKGGDKEYAHYDVSKEESLANAELICRAVNNFNTLVEALNGLIKVADHIDLGQGLKIGRIFPAEFGKALIAAGNAATEGQMQ